MKSFFGVLSGGIFLVSLQSLLVYFMGPFFTLELSGLYTLQVLYHEFNKEEQLAALEEEKRILEERKKLKEAGVIGSTRDAIDGAASLVGSGVGMVGTGIGAGAGLVTTGFGTVGSGLGKAGKFMGRTITGHSSKRSGTTTPVNSVQENGGAKPLQ